MVHFTFWNVCKSAQNVKHYTFSNLKWFWFQIYELRVMETKPDKAVSIIECDMNVSLQFLVKYSSQVNEFFSQVFIRLKSIGYLGTLRRGRNPLQFYATLCTNF